MGVDQPRHVVVGGVVGNAQKPCLNQRLRNSVEIHLLQAGLGAQVQDREAPDVSIGAIVTIDPRGTHAGIASEVVSDKAMLLQPLGDPARMVSQRR